MVDAYRDRVGGVGSNFGSTRGWCGIAPPAHRSTAENTRWSGAGRRLVLAASVALVCAVHVTTVSAAGSELGSEAAASVFRHERFENWELICQAAPSDTSAEAKSRTVPGRTCKVSQQLAVQGTDRTVFMVAVLATAPTGPKVMILSAPLGGYLVPGVELRVDRKTPTRVLFETCNAAGCHGGFRFDGKIAKEILSGHEMKAKLWATKDKPIEISIALDGLSRAVTAMDGGGR